MMPDGKLGLIDYGACMRLERKPDTTDHFEKGVNGLWVFMLSSKIKVRLKILV